MSAGIPLSNILLDTLKPEVVEIALNGHSIACDKNGLASLRRQLLFGLGASPFKVPTQLCKALLGLDGKQVRIDHELMYCCDHCGEIPEIWFNGEEITFGPCPQAKNTENPVVVKIPSGKLAFTNDVRKAYAPDKSFGTRVNTKAGKNERSNFYAGLGLVCFPATDDGADLFFTSPTKLAVGKREILNKKLANPVDGAKRIAAISTGVWIYCLCDAEELKAKNNGKLPEETHVVTIDPGTYKFTDKYHSIKDWLTEAPLLYATIDKV